jgi:hypothetical protein
MMKCEGKSLTMLIRDNLSVNYFLLSARTASKLDHEAKYMRIARRTCIHKGHCVLCFAGERDKRIIYGRKW